MQETEYDDHEGPSKSQRKREAQELKKLGTELLDFSDDALRQLMLPEVLLEALRTAKRIKSHGARKRQLQYIGRLMQDIDADPVRQAVTDRNRQHATHTQEFHQTEALREQLIAEGDSALPAVLAKFPYADRQHLRKLVRQARKEQETRQPPRASRRLFRYLRDLQAGPDY